MFFFRGLFRNPTYTSFIRLESMTPRELAAEDDQDASEAEGGALDLHYDEEAEPAPRPRTIHGSPSFFGGTSTKRRRPRRSETATRFPLVWPGTFSTADCHGAVISTPGRRDSEDVSFATTAPLRRAPLARTDKNGYSRRQQGNTNRSAPGR